MKKYILIASTILLIFSSCNDFLTLQPEYLINENNFYQTANDFEKALIGNYSALQQVHSISMLYLAELTTDNAYVEWAAPTVAETECDEVEFTSTNQNINNIWDLCFTTIARCNNILDRIDAADISDNVKSQYKGESLFLRAYCYFYMVRLFGDLPLVETAFRSPNEIATFDMSRKPVDEIYQLIESDLIAAADYLRDVTGLSKSRASEGAAKTLLGKVYLTSQDYDQAEIVLKAVIDLNDYTLEPNYATLFTNGNDELAESIFEIKYLSGNVGEGNSFSTIFTPPLYNMAIFPGNMQGSGRVIPTDDMANAYEPGDLRRSASIADSVLLQDGTYASNIYGLKFVDFTTGIAGDGGINFTSLRYADVLLMYAETLNENNKTPQALIYLNMVRNRAGLISLSDLSKSEAVLALEQERRVEFFCEGHRWFDLVRTDRLQEVMNKYFNEEGLSFSVEDYELLMPIPQNEIDIDPTLVQNPGY